jgi:hypothetical protein
MNWKIKIRNASKTSQRKNKLACIDVILVSFYLLWYKVILYFEMNLSLLTYPR